MSEDGGSLDEAVSRLVDTDDEAAVRDVLERLLSNDSRENDASAARPSAGHRYEFEDIIAVLTHDLRNPQAVARGSLQQYRETGDPQHLDRVERAQQRVEAITEDALELIRSGGTIEETEWLGLSETAHAVWQTIDTEHATLEVERQVLIDADTRRFERLLQNLFENAITHGGPDVEVTVETTADGFYVEDDGPGVDSLAEQKAFEFGYSTDDDGTGFGLCIVSEIATAHGWSLSLHDAPDGGARVQFSHVDVRR